MLDTAPAGLLDERGVAHRREHHLTLVLLGALVALAPLNGFLAQQGGAALFSSVDWVALLLASFLAVSTLPAAALTWTWPTPTDEVGDLNDSSATIDTSDRTASRGAATISETVDSRMRSAAAGNLRDH